VTPPDDKPVAANTVDWKIWLLGLLTPWAGLTAWFWFLCDDAYITFRFSRNLALGRGLVFNVGESPPVEGYSNFLWMLIAAAMEAANAPVETLIPMLSALAGAALIWRVFAVARQLGATDQVAFAATMPLAVSPAMAIWSTSGLATMPFALLVFVLMEQLFLRDEDTGPLAAAAAMGVMLIRTEGWAWVVVMSVLATWIHQERLGWAGAVKRLAGALLPTAALFVVYNGWRLNHYGTLVPNTALVKVGFGPSLAWRGLRYVLLFGLTTITPILALLPAPLAIQRGRKTIAVLLLCLGFLAYGALVGGDFMPFGRLLLPAVPLSSLVLAVGLCRLPTRLAAGIGILLGGVAALPGFDIHLAPEPLRAALHFRLSDRSYLSEYQKWDNMVGNTEGFLRRGRALAIVGEPGDAVVSGAVGAMGYASDLWVWDQYGLVTKEVAYRPLPSGELRESPGHDKKVPAEFFEKYSPRFLYARAVKGRNAASHMKDSLYRWDVDPLVMDRYVPDFVEIDLGDGQRHFLFMVRHADAAEDPAALWNGFEERRKRLHTELKEEAASDDEETSEG
jgi:arabinofuranosyltransferase